MFKFPSIDQFRVVYKHVRENCDFHGKPYPIIRYLGKVKLHGTNAGIAMRDGKLVAQSRERTLSVTDDNAGFAKWVNANESWLLENLNWVEGRTYFGEWIGPGIQSGVAISNLPHKMFVVFSMTDDGERFSVPDMFPANQEMVHINILDSVSVDVDFNGTKDATDLFEKLTMEYEAECPFAKLYGISGIGEGLVWTPAPGQDDLLSTFGKIWFKTKGAKHGSSATKQKVSINITPEQAANRSALVEILLPEWRLNQGLEHFSLDKKNTGKYIAWIVADVEKEEMDTIAANIDSMGMDAKAIMSEVTKVARQFFLKKFDTI